MDLQVNPNDIIYMLRSNHFVQEYLDQKPIVSELKNNPRFQSIIWHISVMLKRHNVDSSQEEGKKWIDNYMNISEQGEIMYSLSDKDRYYLTYSNPGIQLVKYFADESGVKRQVKEMNESGETTLQILSIYNQDGIEESQIVEDLERNWGSVFKRVENHPELRQVIEYSLNEKNTAKHTYYQKRFLLTSLEDFHPNSIELDPLNISPLFKFGTTPFYNNFSPDEINQLDPMSDRILPLPEKEREEILQNYKELNQTFHRTTVFEHGLAKMLCVKNRDYIKP